MSMAVFATEPDISDTNGTFTYTDLKHDSTSSSLTVTNIGETSHTFQLYQIFVGDVAPVSPATDPATATLANITWGSGVTDAGKTALGDATTKAKTLASATEAKAFADALVEGKYLTGADEKTAAAGAAATWSGLNPGYYLVIDKVDTQGTETTALEKGAYTAYIMQVVGTVTRNAKLDIPSVEKKVQDTNDSKDATATANADDYNADGKIWKDSADYDVNDVIPYKITGTLPANFAEYETYKTYKFTDTLSAGLTPPAEADVKVTLDSLTGTDIKSLFDVKVTGQKIEVTLKSTADLRTNASPKFDKDSKIIVSYSATLNNQAKIGADGNPNTVDLEYSNNPNKGGEGDKGKTPEDKNIVFTYTVNVNKVTGSQALGGAAFALYKKYVGTLPTGKTAATEIKYDNGKKDYAIPSGEQWVLVEQKTADANTKTFGFDRVDDGEYLLVETTTPAGYNSVKPMQFKVEAAHVAEDANPTLTSVTGTDSKPSGSTTLDSITLGALTVEGKLSGVTTNVNNESGTVLPSTGGMGTTIFYIIGVILVLGAGIVLVTRRRMSAN
jgi:fimbrial isopeptide formation D2 family protein/LPXTG-motif cell wall-anchored protein